MSTDEHYTVGKTTLTMPTIFEDKLLKKEIAELQRAKEELLAALQFVYDMAEEEYNYQTGNVGAECALRHIVRKSSEAIAKHK